MKPDISLATKSAFLLANDKYGLATTHPESGGGSCKPGNIAAMDELRPSASAASGRSNTAKNGVASTRRGDVFGSVYSGSQVGLPFPRCCSSLHWVTTIRRLSCGSQSPFRSVCFSLRPSHSGSSSATWPCPRCAKRFFFSAFAFDPFFTRRCRHCGLLLLKKAEVKNLWREEREPELQ